MDNLFEASVVLIKNKPVIARGNTLKEALQNLIKNIKEIKKSYLIYIDTTLDKKTNSLRVIYQKYVAEYTNIHNISIKLYRDNVEYNYDNFLALNLPYITDEDKEYINHNLHLYLYDYRTDEWIEKTGRKYYNVMSELAKYIDNKYCETSKDVSGFHITIGRYYAVRVYHKDGSKEFFPIVTSKRMTKKLKKYIETYNSDLTNTKP